MSFTIDWDQIGSDGSFTFGQGTSDEVTVSVATPLNAEHHQWSVNDGMLTNTNVSQDSYADIAFDTPVENVTFTLLDIDTWDKITIMTKDADGNPVPVSFEATGTHSVDGSTIVGTATTDDGPSHDDGSQDVEVTIAGPVSSFWIVLDDGTEREYSGAVGVSDITFDVAAVLDGTVEGTAGDDLIDGSYLGDPDGDIVDNNDAILPGDVGNDDLILAGAGNDTVLAGDGQDTVYGDNTVIRSETVQIANLAGADYTLAVWELGAINVTNAGYNHDPFPNYSHGEHYVHGSSFTFNDGASPVAVGVCDDDGTFSEDDGNQVLSQDVTLNGVHGHAGHQFMPNYAYSVQDSAGNVVNVYAVEYGDNQILGFVSDAPMDMDETYTFIELTDTHPHVHFDDLAQSYVAATDDEASSDADNFGDDQLYGGADDDTIYGDGGDSASAGGLGVTSGVLDPEERVDGDLYGRFSGTVYDGEFDFSTHAFYLGDDIGVLDGENRNELRGQTFTQDGSDDTRVAELVDIDFTGAQKSYVGLTTVQRTALHGQDDQFSASNGDGFQDVVVVNDVDVTFTMNDGTVFEHIRMQFLRGEDGKTYLLADDHPMEGTFNSIRTTVYQNDSGIEGITIESSSGNINGINPIVGNWAAGQFETTQDGEGGDDLIDGGAGADAMFGEGGDDTFVVDTASEGAGDVVVGGNGPDQTTDYDTLDLRGAGPVTIDQTADEDDAGAFKGTVTFEDGSVLTFSQIEEILSDPTVVTPEAQDDVAEVDEDGSVIIPVLDNDVDPNGDPLEVIDATSPNGQVTINDDGTISFTPEENFNGETTITYTVTDPDGNTDTATVTVTVSPVNDAPIATDDTAETTEDSPVVIDVLGNDDDVDGDDLTITSATVPADQGTVEIVNGQLVFTPAEDFNGDATITYTVSDGNGGTDQGEVVIDVTPVNDAPDAVNDAIVTPEDEPVTIDVLDNDFDVDGDDLTITAATVPADQGTVAIVNGQLVFTPAEDFNGPATISYAITDGNGGTDVAEVVVDVTPVNDAPEAVNDIAETLQDEPVTIPVLENDDDVDGDPLTIVDASVPPEQGTVEIVDNELVFTPAPGFVGQADITYTVEDPDGATDEGSATVNVGDVPEAPIAVDDTATTDEETPVTIDVLDNDSDPEGDPLTITEASVPADQGTVEIVNNELVFTPAEDFNGDATITYTITDGNGGNDLAEVVVTVDPVNDAPIAVDDIENTDEDQSVVVDLLGNDVDPDGDTLTLLDVTVPAEQGTVVDNGDGTVTFTPAPNFTGPAEITYTVQDPDGVTDEGTATVNVGAVNDAPEAVDDADTTAEDTPITVDLLDNDSDPDGDDIRVISATVPAEQGTVELNDDGTAVFTPAPDFNGEATITYTVSDGDGLTDTAEHVIDVTPVNDAPDAVNDVTETPEDTPVTIDVLGNDTDPDEDPLTITAATVPADQGTVEIVNNELVFTPAEDFNGPATISYAITDGNGGTDVAEVVVDLTPVNDAPEAADDIAETPEDTPVTIPVLDNDGDVDGDPLTLVDASVPPEQGTVEIVDNELVFTPAPGFVGPADITYTVEDPDGATDEGSATVNVGEAIDPPVAVDDTASTDEDTPVTIDVLGNDTDPNDDPLTITGASVPAEQGTVEVVNDELVFTPAEDFNGEATITYSITDGNGGTDTAEVVVTVDPVNDAPVAVDDIVNTDEDEPVVVDLLGNDTDPDGDELILVDATVPAEQGTLVDNGDGTVTFTPAPGYTGPAEITYTVSDPDGAEDEGTATVNVGAVNDSPLAVDDADTTEEDTPITVDLLDNDSDPDGDDIRVISATVPEEQGTVELNDDGTAVFTPADDFTGEATITYTISDGDGLTDTAEHVIDVTPVNDAPDASEDNLGADEDTVEVIGNVLENDEDPEGDPLTVAEVNGSPAGVGQPVPGDNGGLITIEEDGTVTFDPNGDFDALRPGESEQTTVTYTVTDPDGQETTETVTITVDGINDDPDAINNAYVVAADEGFGDVDGNVLTDNSLDGRDSDPENTTLKVIAVGGTVAGVGTVVAGDNGGQFIINEDGTVDFNANGDFDGLPLGDSAQTSVTYTIEDEDGGTDTATVTFTVGGSSDGTIQGTSGDDVIVPGYVDPDGDILDGNDAILPGDVGDDDLVFGFDGDDSINAGDGVDEVYGGLGNDTISGGANDDLLNGDEGDDVVSGDAGDDVVLGGDGNDALDGGTGDDLIGGDAGDDVVDGGDGDDDIYGGDGNDTLFGSDGNDYIGGGAGDDVIDASTPNLDAAPDIGYPGLYQPDQDPNDDLDTVFGGAGNDSIITGDDDDTIYAGSGDDTVDSGWDDDLVYTASGNDTVVGGEGNDEIFGGAGSDLIYGGLDDDAPDFVNIPDDGTGQYGPDLVTNNNGDTLYGGDGDDTIYGKDDVDTLYGDAGDDVLDGGVDDDELYGGEGDDTLIDSQGNDQSFGGFGSDTFVGGNGGDTVVGGEDPDGNDIDVLDLTGTNIENIEYTDGDPESGVVTFQDGTTMTFAEIENVIPCFTPGTMIATPTGEKLVEELREGDKVITRDNGIQKIAWTGRKTLDGRKLVQNPHLKPILIKAGSLGDGLPERDMLVSPNHRVLVASELTQLYFEEREVLAAAKHMTGARGIHSVDAMSTTYIHFMCENHEVVLSNGAWTESFQPGDYSLKGLGNSQRNEIFELFPELATQEGRDNYQAARKMLKKHEARLLMK